LLTMRLPSSRPSTRWACVRTIRRG
jgi:hypothetical protein